MNCRRNYSILKFVSIAALLLLQNCLHSQSVYELASLPEPVSNNAVCGAQIGDTFFVYSFGGIDSSKIFSGIHKKVWRYNSVKDTWQSLAPLPSGNGRIAAGASYVNGKIYIIGGYEVFPNGIESSFREVHVFDPYTNQYEDNAPPLLRAIDDHVQISYRDSLIYVVTGWSHNANVADVQIFNTYLNKWSSGTWVPNSNNYKAFGASGEIIGDTLYYLGGARMGVNFPLTRTLRKAYIHPESPDVLDWSFERVEEAVNYSS